MRANFSVALAENKSIMQGRDETAGFETIVVTAVEPGISADDESYKRLKGRQRKRWLDLLERVSSKASSIGASWHLLYIGRKPVLSDSNRA